MLDPADRFPENENSTAEVTFSQQAQCLPGNPKLRLFHVGSEEMMKGKKLNRTVGIGCLGILAVLLLLFYASGWAAYFYALSLEDRTLVAKTREEMERVVSLSSSHEIFPKDSQWGAEYKLKPGEKMVQYKILWRSDCPLDVVYDHADRVQAVFTSYE